MTQQIPIDIAKDSLIPIIVGVTGHRYITSRNEPVIRVVFEELDRKYPNTPIVVLSPLAEGSDRLVSQIALETPRKTGAANSLICPLPLTLEEYEKDFNPESKKEFQNLLNKASGYFSFPSVMHSSNDREVERRMQYEQVGKYIARHSHILIALWDGEDKSENIGGTSHIVKLRHENKLDLELHPFEEIEIGPIYHFPIKKKENGVVEIGSKREIFPGMRIDGTDYNEILPKQRSTSFYAFLERLEIFNRDIRMIDDALSEQITINRQPLFKEDDLPSLTQFHRRLLNQYAVADTMAIRYQYSTGRALRTLFILAFLALFCFELYAHIVSFSFILVAYPLILSIGFLVVHIAKTRRIQNKYLYFRTLAEFLRVHFFLRVLGETKIIRPNLRKKDKLDWSGSVNRIVSAVMSFAELNDRVDAKSSSTQEVPQQFQIVLNSWVKRQATYFRELSDLHEKLLERRHFNITVFFLAGPALSLILLILELFFAQTEWIHMLHPFFIAAIGTTLAVAATIGGYTGKTAVAAKVERFRCMSDVFDRAVTELERRLANDDSTGTRSLLIELFEIALEENVDWLISGLEHEIEVPKG